MSGVVILILKEIAPVVVAPLVTSLVKWLTKRFGGSLPAIAKIAVSVTAGAATAVTTGDASELIGLANEAVTGAIYGLAGSKGRDVLVGKPEAVPAGDKGTTFVNV